MKRGLPYILLITICLAGYFVSNSIIKGEKINNRIEYVSDATEVFMVWGINYLQKPSPDLWPSGSFEKNELIYTKLSKDNSGDYSITLELPVNTILNYWMVQKKDKAGNDIDVWDAGGEGKEYARLDFKSNSKLKPGFFILLAGLLPLLFHYLRNRNKHHDIIEETPSYQPAGYIPQLDVVRAFAVLLVIFHHWLPANSFLHILPNGQLGVNIFFVLSGYLITNILLKAKIDIAEKGLPPKQAFKNFYIRRTLRIFPIYYLFLFGLYLLNDPELFQNAVYYFTYTSNYLFYSEQYFPARLSHLWSLGVEEQFYLIWPWIIVLSGRKLTPYLIALFFVIGLSSRFILTEHGWWSELLTNSCFDAFAIGGILAWFAIYKANDINKLRKYYPYFFVLSVVMFILSIVFDTILLSRTIHSILAINIIYYCIYLRNNTIANFVLGNKWLIRMGKITYGIYLYHLVIPECWRHINNWFSSFGMDFLFNSRITDNLKPYWYFIQQFAMVIVVSVISWYVIEKPINNLKSRFVNRPAKPIK